MKILFIILLGLNLGLAKEFVVKEQLTFKIPIRQQRVLDKFSAKITSSHFIPEARDTLLEYEGDKVLKYRKRTQLKRRCYQTLSHAIKQFLKQNRGARVLSWGFGSAPSGSYVCDVLESRVRVNIKVQYFLRKKRRFENTQFIQVQPIPLGYFPQEVTLGNILYKRLVWKVSSYLAWVNFRESISGDRYWHMSPGVGASVGFAFDKLFTSVGVRSYYFYDISEPLNWDEFAYDEREYWPEYYLEKHFLTSGFAEVGMRFRYMFKGQRYGEYLPSKSYGFYFKGDLSLAVGGGVREEDPKSKRPFEHTTSLLGFGAAIHDLGVGVKDHFMLPNYGFGLSAGVEYGF